MLLRIGLGNWRKEVSRAPSKAQCRFYHILRSKARSRKHVAYAHNPNLAAFGLVTSFPDVGRLATLFAALCEGMLEMAMLDPENVQAESELVGALDVLFHGLRP